MYAIVKFNGQEPIVFGISNSAYAYHLSTMENVEWVCGATITAGGQLSPVVNDKVTTTSALHATLIKPFLPGEPNPWARFREQHKSE